MKIYRDSTFIQNKENLGKRFSMVGLGILFVGLIASFIPTWYPPETPGGTALIRFLQQYWTIISFVALPVGFICASLGSYHINRFARRRWPGAKQMASPDQLLERNLKGMDDKYAYFAWSLPASYLVMGPCGILLFAVRSDKGKIVVNGDKWREPFSIGRIFTIFAREGLGNPRIEIEDHTSKIQKLLANATEEERGGHDFTSIPVSGAAVFLNQDTEIDATNPSIPALRPDQLKGYIRGKAKEVRLQTSLTKAVTRYLEAHATHSKAE